MRRLLVAAALALVLVPQAEARLRLRYKPRSRAAYRRNVTARVTGPVMPDGS